MEHEPYRNGIMEIRFNREVQPMTSKNDDYTTALISAPLHSLSSYFSVFPIVSWLCCYVQSFGTLRYVQLDCSVHATPACSLARSKIDFRHDSITL
jgi:hypothetical protein